MLFNVDRPGRPVVFGEMSAGTVTGMWVSSDWRLDPHGVSFVTGPAPFPDPEAGRAVSARWRTPDRPPAVKLAQVCTITPWAGSTADSTSP